jgi:hypothetical protein
LIEPFDILLHATEDGVNALQARFSTWLRTLSGEARFLCWQMPATLADKIAALDAAAEATEDEQRRILLVEYRRHYERMNTDAQYQRALCGMALWNDQNPRAVAGGLASALDTPVTEAAFPALFEGRYTLRDRPLWHLAPLRSSGGTTLLGSADQL